VHKLEHVAQPNQNKPYSFIKSETKKKLVNPKQWHATFQQQSMKHGPGAINREKNQRNIPFEI
jgi:hypothetical protein